jgi:hypothetical protein
MHMLDEDVRCQNPQCRKPILTVPGHRRRQYCDDACKQKAHRIRQDDAQRAKDEAARLARIEQERLTLLKKWGNLLPETIDLLLSMPSSEEKIVKVIRAEQEWFRQSQLQERNTLLEYLMLQGEQLDFPTLTNDDFRLEQGPDNWLAFCQDGALERLYQARDIVHIKLQAQMARRRLALLAPQS